MPQFYANPYDYSRGGFYFEDDIDDYEEKLKKKWGHLHEVPEHSIDFVDGTKEEYQLWEAGGNNSPAEIEGYFDLLDEPEYVQVAAYAALVLGQASNFDEARRAPDMTVYHGDLREVAENYIEEGIINPDYYFDHESFGRDIHMSGDMTAGLDPDGPDEAEQIDFYESMSDEEMGEYIVDEFYGGNPASVPNVEFYIDKDKLAVDLGMDYTEIEFGGETYTIRPD
jgi:hypothetical protein